MRRFNPGNFYCGTTAEWTSCPRPVRHPDHMSGSGSDYWYGESGVVRYSDHWGSEVASCDWYLDGVARCSFDDHYGTAQGRGAGHALVLTRLQPARRPARLDQGRGVREAACRRRARGRRAARGGGCRRPCRRPGVDPRADRLVLDRPCEAGLHPVLLGIHRCDRRLHHHPRVRRVDSRTAHQGRTPRHETGHHRAGSRPGDDAHAGIGRGGCGVRTWTCRTTPAVATAKPSARS